MELLIVVVNYRTPELASGCVASLGSALGGRCDRVLVVVENGSGDGSADYLREAIGRSGLSDQAALVEAGVNRGFAAGNRLGVAYGLERFGRFRYIMLLNPDTVVRPGAVDELVGWLDRRRGAGAVGARVLNADGSVRPSAFRFNSVAGEFARSSGVGFAGRWCAGSGSGERSGSGAYRTDWVSGAAVVLRSEALSDSGFLDEGYFLYFEEEDLLRRLRRDGWGCWYAGCGEVIHHVGQSTGVTGAGSSGRARPGYWFESRHRYYRRHLGRAGALWCDLVVLAGFGVGRLKRCVGLKKGWLPPHFERDFISHAWRLHGQR